MPRRRPNPEIQAGISARRVPVVTAKGKREHRVPNTAKARSTSAAPPRWTSFRREVKPIKGGSLSHALHAMQKAGLSLDVGHGSLGARFVKGAGRFALGTPAFGYDVATGAGTDLYNQIDRSVQAIKHPLRTQKKPPPLKTLPIVKGMAVGTAQSVRHPLRDPFQTLLLASAAHGAGATVLERSRGVGSAEGVRAKLTRPGHEGGSALHTPIARETTLTMGGKSVQRLEPDNPGLRPLHRARTKRLQAQLDAGPRPEETWRQAWSSESKQGGVVGKAAAVGRRKLGLNAEDVFGREWRAFRRIDPVKGQGYADALIRETKHLTPEELTAMRVALIEGKHAFRNPDEAVSRHINTHLGYASKGIHTDLHQQIAADLAPAASVLRNPSREFLQATARARQLSRRMRKELIGRGLLTEESARQSVATMAEVYGRRDVGRLTHERQRTADELHARLSKLDAKYEQLVSRAAHQLDPMLPKAKQLETLYRNRTRNRLSGGVRRGNMPTVNAEIRKHVEDQIDQAVRANPHLPASRLIMEREAIRAKLNALGEASIAGEKAPSLGTVKSREQVRTGDLGFGMSKPPPGAEYFPSGPQFTMPPKPLGKNAPSYSPRPGPLGIGPKSPSYGRQGTLKHRTGEGPSQGVVTNPAEAIASAYHGHQLGNQAMDFYKQAWDAGSEVKTHPDMVGVRSTAKSTKEHRLEIQRAVHEGDETALAKALDAMTNDTIVKGGEHMPVGHQIDGVRWLPKAALKDMRAAMSDHPMMQAARAVNSPVRFAQVYVRPAYVMTNLPQNYLMGALQHGPVTVARAMNEARATHGSVYGDLRARAMGTSKTDAFRIGAKNTDSLVSRWGRRWTQGITGLTDRHFRDAMFDIRARERGFVTRADRLRLVTDPALHNDFVAVTRRARRDAVDFDSLAPRERQIAEAAYFYPWMSRATVWAGRNIANRPVQSAVLGQGAAYSSPRMEKKLGRHASWMDGYIKSALGVSNPAPVSPYSTPGQLGQSVDAIAHGKSVFSEIGTPFFQMGGAPLSGQGQGGIRAQLGSTFPGNVLKRAGINPTVKGSPVFGKASATWTDTGVTPAVGSYFFGGPFPRQPNAEAQRAGFLKDQSPGRKATLKVYDERQAVYEAAKAQAPDQLENGHLPKQLRQAFTLEAERQAAYAEAAHGHKAGTPEYHLAKLEADLRFLAKHGIYDAKTVSGILDQARSADIETLKTTRADISRRYYQGNAQNPGPLYYISHAKKTLGIK